MVFNYHTIGVGGVWNTFLNPICSNIFGKNSKYIPFPVTYDDLTIVSLLITTKPTKYQILSKHKNYQV
jgi:hypothetical protein